MLVLVALLLSVLFSMTRINAAVNYSVTDLGTLGGNYSRATGINASGQVVGIADTTAAGNNHGFLWSSGSMHDLGTFGGTLGNAQGINTSGQVVGDAYTGGNGSQRPFLYSGGLLTDLGSLGGQPNHGGAYDINDIGQIVGYSPIDSTNYHAFLYFGGTMQDLGTLSGGNSSANAINNLGQVAGVSGNRAFLYSGVSMQDLGTLGGSYSYAFGINDAGHVTGNSAIGGASHVFLFANGSMSDLGTLGRGGYAMGINNLDQIVGTYLPSTGNLNANYAYLYSDGSMLDLNTLIDPTSGWTIEEANAINDDGLIAGFGFNSSGEHHALLLTPVVPEPSTALFLLGPLVALALQRRR